MRSLSDYFQIAGEIAKGGDIRNQPVLWNIYLAAFFDYNVKKGGFAQLLFNLKGEYLKEIEQMLTEISAPTALEFYIKALKICLGNIPKYQRFISGKYTEKNEIKDDLHFLSLDYYKKSIEFSDEVKQYLAENRSVLEQYAEKIS